MILIAAAIAGACVAAFALGDAASAATPRHRPTPTVRLQRQLNRLARLVASQQLQIWALTDRLQGENQTLSVRVENTELFDQWIEPVRGCVDGAYPAFFGAGLIFDPTCLWPALNATQLKPHRTSPRSFRRP